MKEVTPIGERSAPERCEAPICPEMYAAFDNMQQGFMLLDRERRLTNFNARLQEILGFPAGVLRPGATSLDLIEASAALGHYRGSEIAEISEAWTRRLADGTPGNHIGYRPDGRTIRIGYAPFGEDCWVVTYEDISLRVNAEKALAEQNERLDAALTNMPHGVCMFDAEKRLILCNERYVALYALPPVLTTTGTPLQSILDYRASAGSAPVLLSTYLDVADEAEAASDSRNGLVNLQDGRTVRVAYNPMGGGSYVATHEDITQEVKAEAQIRYMGLHDRLGLPNRELLRERIDEALRRMRGGGSFAIHYLDLDNFKWVNDTHGQAVGDLLLKQAAARLQACLLESDTLARLGGDEFVALQVKVESPEQAGTLARRLVDVIAESFDLGGIQVQLGVSVGVSLCPTDGSSVDALLRSADSALLRSKSEGGNTYRFFELATDQRLHDKRLLERDLRTAAAGGEFELYYQPQVNAQSEEITGCEALLRWHRPSHGMVPPGEFITVAEDIGIIIPLGAWVLQQACHEASTWPTHISVAVNLSSFQLKGMALAQTVISALDSSGLSPHRLELEITESALLADSETTINTLNHLRDLGVRIAMDDFGTGYSSLSYLRSFPFDKIKIDRSFIQDLGKKGDCSAIVRAMAGLGKELGMTITAEGVETLEQLQLVRSLGCTEVQGYFFGRPCPPHALRKLCRMDMTTAKHWPHST
jgi:diguanylate cyclase (GGDEF)-like protein